MTGPATINPTLSLTKYEAALHALAECKAVDEVKDVADKAAALQAYGRMAKDRTLEIDAAEIRIRAERRLGEMIAEQKATVGLNPGGRPKETGRDERPVIEKPTLTDAGITKDLSSRAQKLAAVPAEEFEKEVKDWRGRIEEEGKRVSARLEQAGERAMRREKPAPKTGDGQVLVPIADRARLAKADERIKELEDQLEQLRDDLAETARLLRDTQEENESLVRVVEADDQVKAAMAEAKRFRELARVVEERNRGLQGQNHALAADAKRWMNKFKRLEKATKGEPEAVEPGPEPEPAPPEPAPPADPGPASLFDEPLAS